ncbi:MAG: phospho-N-acetylmuramoyl-pentapeptide-transferase [Firmicutes bacterium]|nr:phospho-N-acetylmuramoyl-pentapeptide-transferase [Bacillota bacterium]
METTVVLTFLIAFALQMVLCPIGIPLLHKLKFGQYIRKEGPESHQKKAGTPTMGGIMILLAFATAILLSFKIDARLTAVLLLSFGFGIIGLLDDLLKVLKKNNDGLKAWQKWSLQCIAAGLFVWWLSTIGVKTSIPLLFTHHRLELGFGYYILAFIYILGFVNATNFTDGLDGLASGVTVVVAAFLAFMAFKAGDPLQIAAVAMMGALLGFLVFNVNPAKVFMGDTGSLALGGFVSAMGLLLDMPLVVLIVGFIYVAEVASVMLQVAYFKLTHGKRIFRMAPIHHHFELGGWKETKVVAIFMIVTAVLCMIGLIM